MGLCIGVLGLLGCVTNSAADGTSRTRQVPTLEEIFLEPSIAGLAPEIVSLSPDGRWLLLRWKAGAAETDELVPRLLEVSRPEASGFRGTPLTEIVPNYFAVEGKLGRLTWLPEGARLLATRGRQVLLHDANSGRSAALVVEGPEVAPDVDDPHRRFQGGIRRLDVLRKGTRLEILDDQDAWRLELPGELPLEPLLLDELECASDDLDAPVLALAFSRDDAIVFGKSRAPRDLPAEPEADEVRPVPHVLHRNDDRQVVLEGFDDSIDSARMSPDGRYVFGLTRDESGLPEATIVPDYLTERVTTRRSRRMLAEDGPEPVRAWIWDTQDGSRVPFFEDDAPRDLWLNGFDWAGPDVETVPARLLVTTISADHRERTLHLWENGERRVVFRDRDEAWLGGPLTRAVWRPDGEGLVVGSEVHESSSTPGRAQLFHVDLAGQVTQLTAVEGEVSDFRFADDGGLVFQASRMDPAAKELGWLPREALGAGDPTAVRWFPTRPGFNAGVRAGARADLAVFTHERLYHPPEIHLATPDSDVELTRTVPRVYESFDWVLPERVVVTGTDGVPIHAHVWVPPDWNEGDAPRPTIVFVHGAGYLQNVTESMTEYPLNLLFHARLARLGYPVIDVDYRGSAGYGRDFRTAVQYHLGGRDLDDIHDVVDAQIARGLVARERVGLYGGSYGGFMAMMALFTAPERWAVGCALRSVTDWRTYHPRYTQPRLGKPSTHAEAYALSSPIDHVAGLEDPLLVLHGMLDSNVFAQDSIRLIEELIDLGKDFDAMLYPSQGHGFHDGPHWLDEYRRIERYLLQHLGSPRGAVAQ